MKEALLITAVVLIVIIGYFIMKRFDLFLDKSKKSADKREEEQEKTQVIFLTDKENEQNLQGKEGKEKTE